MWQSLFYAHEFWLLGGAALLVADIVAPGMVLSFLGAGCLAAGVVAALTPLGGLAQTALFAVVSGLGLFFVRPRLRRRAAERSAAKAEARARRAAAPAAASRPAPEPMDLPPFLSGADTRVPHAPAPDQDPLLLSEAIAEPGDGDEEPLLLAEPLQRARPLLPPLGDTAPKPQKAASKDPDPFGPDPSQDGDDTGFEELDLGLPDQLPLSIDDAPSGLPAFSDGPAPRNVTRRAAKTADFSLSLDAPGAARSPLGRPARIVTAVGPITAGLVLVDGREYPAYCDEPLRAGGTALVSEVLANGSVVVSKD